MPSLREGRGGGEEEYISSICICSLQSSWQFSCIIITMTKTFLFFVTQTVLSLLTNLFHFSWFIQHGCARKAAQAQLSGIVSAVLQTITQMRSSHDNIKQVPAKLISFYLSKCEWSLSSHFLQCCVSEWHYIFNNFLPFGITSNQCYISQN